MKTKNDNKPKTKGKINWLVFSIMLIMITICSCVLIFQFKVFEKWDKTEVISAEGVKGTSIYSIVQYEVNGVLYEKTFSYQAMKPHPIQGVQTPGEYYVEYLVSDPNYSMADRASFCIAFTVADIFLIVIFAPIMIWWYKSKKLKE